MISRLVSVLVLFLLTTIPMNAQELRRSLEGLPEVYDPQQIDTASAGVQVLRDLYEGLTTYGEDGSIVPGVAESWDVSDDGMTYTFHLRDARWSNGDMIEAGDFSRAFERLLDPATSSPNAYLLSDIVGARERLDGQGGYLSGVEVIDGRTFTLRLVAAEPLLLTYLAQPAAAPLHSRMVDSADWSNPIVSGPFQPEGFFDPTVVRLVKNEHYHQAASILTRGVVYTTADANEAARRMLVELDLGEFSKLPDEQPDPQYAEVLVSQGTAVYAAIVNTDRIGDLDVRRALSAVLDRHRLALSLGDPWLPTMKLGTGPVEKPSNPNSPECCRLNPKVCDAEPDCGKDTEFPTEIEQMIIGHSLDILSSSANRPVQLAEAMEKVLEAKNVDVSLSQTDDLNEALKGKGYDLVIANVRADLSDPAAQLRWLEGSASGFIGEPRFGDMVQRALAAPAYERAEILASAEKFLLDDKLVIPLVAVPQVSVVSKALGGWQPNAAGVHLSRYMQVVY